MASPSPQSSAHLLIDGPTKFRGILALGSSCVSVLVGFASIYVYYFHYQHRVHLRSHYNNILVTAILLLTLQSVQRSIASATLISGSMSGWFCDVCGGIDIFLNAASLTCIVGFYYTMMALRYNPLRTFIIHCLGLAQSTYEVIYRNFWYVIAGLYSAGLTAAALRMLIRQESSGSPSMFAVKLGYCSIQHDTDVDSTFFLVESGIPLTALVIMSVMSFIAIRSHIGQMRSMTWAQSWPIYVRFFSINFFLFFMIGFIGYSENVVSDGPTTLAFEAVTTPLWCAWIGACFLVSEGIVYNACCADDPEGREETHRRSSTSRHPNNRPRRPSDLDEPLTASTLTPSTTTPRSSSVSLGTRGEFIGSPQQLTRTTLQQKKKRAAAQRKAVNGFTICMQSLLALEVVGVVFVQTNLDLLLQEQDNMLAGRGGRAGGRPSQLNAPQPQSAQTGPPPTATLASTSSSINDDEASDDGGSDEEDQNA